MTSAGTFRSVQGSEMDRIPSMSSWGTPTAVFGQTPFVRSRPPPRLFAATGGSIPVRDPDDAAGHGAIRRSATPTRPTAHVALCCPAVCAMERRKSCECLDTSEPGWRGGSLRREGAYRSRRRRKVAPNASGSPRSAFHEYSSDVATSWSARRQAAGSRVRIDTSVERT